jgi:hypothetical protein
MEGLSPSPKHELIRRKNGFTPIGEETGERTKNSGEALG